VDSSNLSITLKKIRKVKKSELIRRFAKLICANNTGHD